MDDQLNNLQTMLEYYRNKCSQLEFDFVQYQIRSEKTIRLLKESLESNEPGNDADEPGSRTTKSK